MTAQRAAPIPREGCSAAYIEQIIRQRIRRSGQPGGRLTGETALASEFGVSRTMIRGVFRRLAAEKVIFRLPNQPVRVSSRHVRPATDGPISLEVLSNPNFADGEVDLLSLTEEHSASGPVLIFDHIVFPSTRRRFLARSTVPMDDSGGQSRAKLRELFATKLPLGLGRANEPKTWTLEPLIVEPEIAIRLTLPLGSPVSYVRMRPLHDDGDVEGRAGPLVEFWLPPCLLAG